MATGFDDASISGMSWNGFKVTGDRKSIEEVMRLMHVESRLEWFERECERLRDIIKDSDMKAYL